MRNLGRNLLLLGVTLAVNLLIFLTIPLLSRIRDVRPQQEFTGTPTIVGFEQPVQSTGAARRQPHQEPEKDLPQPPAVHRMAASFQPQRTRPPELNVEEPKFDLKPLDMDVGRVALPEPAKIKRVQNPVKAARSQDTEAKPKQGAKPKEELAPKTGQPAEREFPLAQVDQPPRTVNKTQPVYPYQARRRNLSGRVVLKFLVDKRGRVSKVTVVSAQPEGVFEKSARQAVRNWRFTPGKIQGKPVKTWVRVPIRFELH